jgi:hypothetical protein
MSGWTVDRDWAYQYWPMASQILARFAINAIRVDLADDQLDRKQATDLVITTTTGAVAWRARRSDCRYRDLTLRYRRRASPTSEWHDGFEASKIAAGFADFYLYTWVVPGTLEYLLADLDAVRAGHLIETAIRNYRETINRDEITSFTWLTLDECEYANAIKDLQFTLPGWRISRGARARALVKRGDDEWCTICQRAWAVRDGCCGDCWLKQWKEAGGMEGMEQYA